MLNASSEICKIQRYVNHTLRNVSMLQFTKIANKQVVFLDFARNKMSYIQSETANHWFQILKRGTDVVLYLIKATLQ